jgi:hypothetical protein
MGSAAVVQEAVEYMNKIVEMGFTSIWPALSFRLLQWSPTYRRFRKIAYEEVRTLMTETSERY